MILRLAVRAAILCQVALLFPGAILADEASLYTSQGFEDPQFTEGSVENQHPWSIPAGSGIDANGAVIQSARAHEGTQALQLRNTDHRATARLLVSMDHEFYLDFMFFMPRRDEIRVNPSVIFRGRTSLGEWADFLVIQFNTHGNIPDLQNASRHKLYLEDWNRLTFRINPAEGVWDLYINGALAVVSEPSKDNLGFSQITAVDFNWTGKEEFLDGGVFIDNVTLLSTKPDFAE